MTDFLPYLELIYKILIALGVTAGGSGIVLFGKKINSKISKQDLLQNKQILEIKTTLDKLNRYIDIEKKRNTFECRLFELIELNIDSFLATNPGISSVYSSMFIEAGANTYQFFNNIRKRNYKNINIKALDKRAIQIFRTLRSGYYVENSGSQIDTEVLNNLKIHVTYPLIKELLMKLATFQKANYNGTTDEHFLEIVGWYIMEIMNRSLIYIPTDK